MIYLFSFLFFTNNDSSRHVPTRNIIYSMTCPCGQYDYVDSTSKTLANAMHCMYNSYYDHHM